MKKNKLMKLMFVGILMMGMGGCSKDDSDTQDTMVETEALESGDFGATLPFTASNSRQQHQIRSQSLVDSMYIGTGLLNYAAAYFSPKTYTMQEGQFLAYDELNSLLGRESDVNPDGLNPATDNVFDSGNGSVKSAVLVRDVYEVDFIKSKETKGIALAIVLNSSISEGGSGTNSVSVSDEKLQAYGEETARKLVTYMRKIPEIGDTLPIYVALYKDTTKEETLPGAFFSQAYFEGRSSNFTSISEEWVMIPSDRATKLDGTVVTQFTQVKNSLKGYLPDDVAIIGKGKFEDGKLSELRITVDMYAKTATEALSLTQYLKSQLSTFASLEYKIQVEVRCQDETIATMVRSVGDKDVNVNTLL